MLKSVKNKTSVAIMLFGLSLGSAIGQYTRIKTLTNTNGLTGYFSTKFVVYEVYGPDQNCEINFREKLRTTREKPTLETMAHNFTYGIAPHSFSIIKVKPENQHS